MSLIGIWVEVKDGRIFEVVDTDDSPFVEAREVIYNDGGKLRYSNSTQLINKSDIIDDARSYKNGIVRSMNAEKKSSAISIVATQLAGIAGMAN